MAGRQPDFLRNDDGLLTNGFTRDWGMHKKMAAVSGYWDNFFIKIAAG